MSNAASRDKIRRMTGISILLAVVVVLTLLGNFVRFGPFPITLALAPIIIGAAVYGASAGAVLGFAFSLVVFITGVMGWDGGTVMLLMSASPVACVLVCLAKGTVAGWLAGLLYELLSKKNVHLGVVAAGIICPVSACSFSSMRLSHPGQADSRYSATLSLASPESTSLWSWLSTWCWPPVSPP